MLKRILLSCVCLGIPLASFAGTTGKLSGMITDSETGEAIPGVSVVLQGTVYGGISDASGNYALYNIPAGSYSLEASSIGYAKTTTENVKVIADYGAILNVKLKPESIQTDEVVVVAERPLIEATSTSSVQIITSETINNLPTRGYNDVVSLQAGVVEDEDNGNLFVRGGRAGEVAYFVDGVSQNNPLTGTANTSLNNNAIEQVVVITGGFNAEYGRVMSGAVNTTTKSGGSDFNGSLEYVTDKISPDESYNYNVYGGTIGGPLFTDKIKFFFSGEIRDYGDRFPRASAGGELPHNGLEGWTGQGKLNFKLMNNLDLELSGLMSFDDIEEYSHFYKFDIAHSPRREDTNRSLSAKIKQTLGSKTFYEVYYNNFYNQRYRGDGVHFKDLASYGRDSNPRHDDYYTVFYNADQDTIYSVANDTSGTAYKDLFGTATTTSKKVDGTYKFYDANGNEISLDQVAISDDTLRYSKDEGHLFSDFLHSESSYHGIGFNMTTHAFDNHKIKFGFEGERHTLRRYHHIFPELIHKANVAAEREGTLSTNDYDALIKAAYQDVDAFGYAVDDPDQELSSTASNNASTEWREDLNGAKHPITLGAYVQDTFEWGKFVLNAGLRFDYLNSDTKALKNPGIPLGSKLDTDPNNSSSSLDDADLVDAKTYTKVSPRLGLAFPATKSTHFYFSYGKFYQQPHLENLYVNYDYLEYKIRDGGYYFAMGNPNLKPEETIAYEVGIQKTFGDNLSFGVKAFYKDVNDLVQVVNIQSPDIAESDYSYATYVNQDYGTVKGLDLEFEMRRTNHIAVAANYSLQYAKGSGSDPDTQRNRAWQGEDPVKIIAPLDFDQRHNVSLNVDVRNSKKEGPMVGDFYVLENAGFNAQFNAGSGFPYTPVTPYNEVTILSVSEEPLGKINSEYGPWTYSLDVKFNKVFDLSSRLNLEAYIWVKNLLNTTNEVDIYHSSGSSGTTGYLNTPAGVNELNTNAEDFESIYKQAENNPTNFGQPRQVRMGLILNF
ncbi:MAG: TonB-dependent receptor [Calditrichaeota bacterium]|nr:MAG: TonB-dependent receptor [Calditrichota bacterium]